jgi:hypothetical protein
MCNDTAGNSETVSEVFDVAKDLTPPSVSVSHSPSRPGGGVMVTFVASASDTNGISEIRLYVNGSVANSSTTSTSVSLQASYAVGSTVEYYAWAVDTYSNVGITSTRSFSVGATPSGAAPGFELSLLTVIVIVLFVSILSAGQAFRRK